MKHNLWEYELKAIAGTPALKLKSPSAVQDYKNRSQQYVYLDFDDERYASLFGLCVQKNGFPIDSGSAVVSQLHYGIGFWSGVYSLREHSKLLADRKTVMLLPNHGYEGFSLSQKSNDDRLARYMTNAAVMARMDGYDPSELVICCTGGEELYSILAGFALRERGYILFPEYDFGMVDAILRIGLVPDMVAVRLGDLQDRLVREGIIDNGAWFHEIELSALAGSRQAALPGRQGMEFDESSIAIEMEDTSPESSGGYKQLNDYTSTQYFDDGMLVCPRRDYRDEFLLMTWDQNGSMQQPKLPSSIRYSTEDRRKELFKVCRRLIAGSIRKVRNVSDMESW